MILIKIPKRKYENVQKRHLLNIKKPVKDAIQFYINTCDVINGNASVSQLSRNITPKLNKTAIKSYLSRISTKPFKDLQNIKEVFDNKEIKPDYLNHILLIRAFFSDMLNPSSTIYLENILNHTPVELISLYQDIVSRYSGLKTATGEEVFELEKTNKCTLFMVLEKIYNYVDFRDGELSPVWGAYTLCEELNINVCPYCNRMYTVTIVNRGKDVTRPELDHYFPASKFPMFAISFFNLIPSCKVCNSNIKKNDYLKIDEYIHPYVNSLCLAYKFDFFSLDLDSMEGKNKNNKIFINKNGLDDIKSNNFIAKFSLEEIYGHHKDVVPKYIKKYKYYPDSVMDELVKLLRVEKEELLTSLYNPPASTDIIDTSLGKFHHDLYQQFLRYYKL